MKKSKENILITRTLSEESPLQQLSKEGYHVIAQSFLEIVPYSISEIPSADVYFYYSKNAAKHFAQAANSLYLNLNHSKHAAMGKGTAKELSNQGLAVDFIGDSSPQIVAEKLLKKYSDYTICFVRAKDSTRSIQNEWPYPYTEVIAYRSEEKIVQIEKDIHTIIATSPKSFISAMRSCNSSTLKKVICIGPTTYNAVNIMVEVNTIMASSSTEAALLEAFYKSQGE